MRKIFTFIMLSFTALSAVPFVPVAKAQNITCADRPAGDKTNACANTRFVMTNGGGGGATPGGLSGQVQYNNSGTFGGLTNTQLTALINNATASTSGTVPAFPNNTTTFYRGDGTYSVPSTVSASNPGYAPTFPNNITTSLLGNGTWGSAISNNYTANYTGSSAQSIQNQLDSGPILASSFGVTCNGTTDDSAAMDNFLGAIATSNSKIGIVTGTSKNSICYMGGNPFQIRGGTTVICSQGTILKFNRASSLVIPYGALSGRTYQGKLVGCFIDGQSVVGSVGIDLYDASEWVIRDVYVNNVDIGVSFDGNTASYYNRLYNIRMNTIRSYGAYFNANANSNSMLGFRMAGIQSYGIYCNGGNQNTFYGGSIGNGFVVAMVLLNNCWGSVLSGIRTEDGTKTLEIDSGANYNTYGGLYCDGITSGTPITNAGIGNVKFGASNCTGW